MRQSLFVGTYSIPSPWAGAADGHGAGIMAGSIDLVSGELFVGASHFETDPAFVVADRDLNRVFAVTEVARGGELISVVSTDSQTFGQRTSLVSGSDGPGHVAVDAVHRCAFVSHFHGGWLSIIGLDRAGAPSRVGAVVELPRGANGRDRSSLRSRPHCSVLVDDRWLLAADFGRDIVSLFEIQASVSGVRLRLVDALALPEGTGPRHIAHRRSEPVVYVSNENSASVSVIGMNQQTEPALELLQIAQSPGLSNAPSFPSEIALHPHLGVVYMANRRDNSISVFAINPSDRTITQRQAVDVRGEWPRHFAVSAGGEFLVVGNQNSDNLVSFRILHSGDLEWSGNELSVASPASIAFW